VDVSGGAPDVAGLPERVAGRLAEVGAGRETPLVVACSGGTDSLVLLHLLRFPVGHRRDRLIVAHVDHRMRDGSVADARWLRGVARAWGLPFRHVCATVPPRNEREARDVRWSFLDELARAEGAVGVLSAHHDDDQVETVLHRVLRGTGLRGLAGMRLEADGRIRPLLGETRATLEAWADRSGLRARHDPTNALPLTVRNRLRHEVLPLLDEVRPGVAGALLRLGRLAADEERALEQAEEVWIAAHGSHAPEAARTVDLGALRALPAEFRARVLRRVSREVGVRLDAAGTRAAVQFTSAGPGGAECRLPGGLLLRRSLSELRISRDAGAVPADRALTVSDRDAGRGEVVVGGVRWAVEWGPEEPAFTLRARFAVDPDRFPLRVRAWRPGDRLGQDAEGRTAARAWARAGVPRHERMRRPVVEDRRARLLWVPGARAPVTRGASDDEPFFIGIGHVDQL
jgi:tRNA(Ile)-lysidine synthase